ncbi:MAG: glutamyl-tRNA reductase [Actinomycetota bacterium]
MNPLGLATITHAQAPLDVLERVSFIGDDVASSLERLRAQVGIKDAAILSTCNRTEIYASFDGPADPSRLAWFLAQDRHVCWSDMRDHVGLHTGDDAVAHLFWVAAGVDSLAFGEAEIVAQIKAVHAELQGSSRHELLGLFEAAIRASRAVRSRVDVGEAGASLGTAAVAAAGLADVSTRRRVLLVGAGKIARSVVTALRPGTEMVIASRRLESAEALAAGRGTAVSMESFPRELASADVVFFCASSRRPLLDAAGADAVTATRRSPLVAVDLGLPRNVAAEVRAVGGIDVIDLDGLRSHTTSAQRIRTLTDVEPLIAEEVSRYRQAAAGRRIAPLIDGMRSALDSISEEELGRAFPDGDPERDRSQQMVRRLLGRVLHGAITEARRAASAGDLESLAAVARTLGAIAPASDVRITSTSSKEEVA